MPEHQTAEAVTFAATKAPVDDQGVPPDSFLRELVGWAAGADLGIFAENSEPYDVMGLIKPTLGPWKSIYHRRAALLETMRVLGGFESSWNWMEGKDMSSHKENDAETMSSGLWQVSFNSRQQGRDLKDLLRSTMVGDGIDFQIVTKQNHLFAMEYAARLFRHTTHANGPLLRGEVLPFLSRDAVAEFEALLAFT